MDSRLEGTVFRDFHNSLSVEIRKHLLPQLPDDYRITVESSVRMGRKASGHSIPDVSVKNIAREDREPYGDTNLTAPTRTLPAQTDGESYDQSVQIMDGNGYLVTSIEVLSPSNKTKRGHPVFREKQDQLALRGVNLLELDLLRNGRRDHILDQDLRAADYLVQLFRAAAEEVTFWTFARTDSFPVVPVPLLPADGDIVLNLPLVYQKCYDENGFAQLV